MVGRGAGGYSHNVYITAAFGWDVLDVDVDSIRDKVVIEIDAIAAFAVTLTLSVLRRKGLHSHPINHKVYE